MKSNLSDLLAKLLGHRDVPHPDGGLYLRRFFLSPRWFPIRVFLHCFYTPDPDRHLHDHPWDFWTLPLTSYEEELPENADGRRFRMVSRRRLHFRSADYVHRVTGFLRRPLRGVRRFEGPLLPVSSPVWTFVFAKKARREWGFWVDGRWVHWRDYLTGDKPDVAEQNWEDVVE